MKSDTSSLLYARESSFDDTNFVVERAGQAPACKLSTLEGVCKYSNVYKEQKGKSVSSMSREPSGKQMGWKVRATPKRSLPNSSSEESSQHEACPICHTLCHCLSHSPESHLSCNIWANLSLACRTGNPAAELPELIPHKIWISIAHDEQELLLSL